MNHKPIWTGLAAAIVSGALLSTGAAAEDAAIATIPALHALFGAPDGQRERPIHTKGVVGYGSFTPAPGAVALSSAPHLAGGSVHVTMRLSNFDGLPSNPDSGPLATPHGMAIRFDLPDGADSDIVAHSYNGFPSRTVEEFLAFVRVLKAGNGTAPPGTGELDRFLAMHPAAAAFLAPEPPPRSYANESFFGVNAFIFVNSAGERRFGRYRIVPVAGAASLSEAEAAQADPNYLARELADRLAHGPVSWRIMVQLPGDGDPVEDGSIAWPADRPLVELGTVRLQSLDEDSVAAERGLAFSPVNLVPGIEPSDDPMLVARGRAYDRSYLHRKR